METTANFRKVSDNKLMSVALVSKLREMEISAETMEETAWMTGDESTAMTSNGAKIAYRAVIGLIEKGIV